MILGSDWDPLLAKDTDGALVRRLDEVVDGEFQKYTVMPGGYIREHFFGVDPRLEGAGGRFDGRRDRVGCGAAATIR